MVSVKVELIGTLQRKQDKKKSVVTIAEPATVMALAQSLGIISSSNSGPSILILVNGKEISVLDGLNTVLEDGASVTFIPVSHGG